jgi:hypothetical protein
LFAFQGFPAMGALTPGDRFKALLDWLALDKKKGMLTAQRKHKAAPPPVLIPFR